MNKLTKIAFIIFVLFNLKTEDISANESNEIQEACVIKSYQNIYRLSPSQFFNSKEVIIDSTCDIFINNKFSSLLSSTEGTALATHLINELKEDFPHHNIEIFPPKIFMANMNDLLKDRLANKTNLFFTDIKLSTSKKILALKENERIDFMCDICNTYGDRNVKYDVTNVLEGTKVSNWISTKIAAKINVLKASHNLGINHDRFTKDDFILEDILTTEPSKFISSLNEIKFHKPNKALIKGMPITLLDITPIQLVKYGTPVKLILKNQNISILKNAIPHRSGSFGEIIELKNPQNNKLITGKVIDFNKVLIEL